MLKRPIVATVLLGSVATLTHAGAAVATDTVSTYALNRTIHDNRVVESSGLARSTYDRRALWTHNDGGDQARLFAVGARGWTRAVLSLSGARNVDFEDISAGPNHQLWVGDIGDDNAARPTVQLYRVTEPATLANRTVTPVRYNLRYPDGPRNAEALLVHPTTGRVFVVSKGARSGGVYAAPTTLAQDHVNTLTKVAQAPAGVTAGSFAPDGKSIVLATQTQVFTYSAFGATPTVTQKPALNVGESAEVSRNGTSILVGSEGSESPVLAMAMPTVGSQEAPTSTDPITPAPSPLTGLGVYNGNAGEKPDEKTIAKFGAAPQVASSYYQPNQRVNLTYETARINRGTSPNITITTKGTQLIAGIASGNATALAWLDTYVAGLKRLAAVNPDVPVYATLEHEYKAKVLQNLVTGASADPATYGRALSVFYRKAAAASSNIHTSYWMVAYDRSFEGRVGAAFTARPDAVLFDPYANSASETVASMTREDLAWIRNQPWYDGQPIALAEFGMPVRYGDEALARFYTSLRGQLDALGLEWAILFNRSRDNDHQIAGRQDGRTFPEAVAAFASSLSHG